MFRCLDVCHFEWATLDDHDGTGAGRGRRSVVSVRRRRIGHECCWDRFNDTRLDTRLAFVVMRLMRVRMLMVIVFVRWIVGKTAAPIGAGRGGGGVATVSRSSPRAFTKENREISRNETRRNKDVKLNKISKSTSYVLLCKFRNFEFFVFYVFSLAMSSLVEIDRTIVLFDYFFLNYSRSLV